MVSFRLTHEDYHLFRQACEAHRARSVSELARIALKSLVAHAGEPMDNQLRELREQVRALTADVERLAGRVSMGPSGGETWN
jgi:hypothetical protein